MLPPPLEKPRPIGLGFSPLPYRLQLNRRDLSTVQPESTTVALVSFFFNRVREPQVGKQQQAAATERPTALGAVAMELSASFRVNVRASWWAQTSTCKKRLWQAFNNTCPNASCAFATRKTCEFAELAHTSVRQSMCFQRVANGHRIASFKSRRALEAITVRIQRASDQSERAQLRSSRTRG